MGLYEVEVVQAGCGLGKGGETLPFLFQLLSHFMPTKPAIEAMFVGIGGGKERQKGDFRLYLGLCSGKLGHKSLLGGQLRENEKK